MVAFRFRCGARAVLLFLLFASLAGVPTHLCGATGSSRPSDAALARLEQLMEDARKADANDPARAVPPAREALALAETLGTLPEIFRARAQLAESLRRHSAYAEARTIVDAGLALPYRQDPPVLVARAALIFESGQIHWNRSDYVAAEACYVEAQQIAEKFAEVRLIIRVLNARGIVARHQKMFAPAERYFRSALELAESRDESELRLQIRNNLAILLYDQHRFDEARVLLLENLRTHSERKNRRSMANALINLGSLENTAGNAAAALPHFEQALALRLELGVPRHIASARISLATTFARLGRGQDALAQLQLAAGPATQIGSHELLGNLHNAYAEAYASVGNYRAALESQRQAQKENESVASEATTTAIAELRERFEAEKRQRQIAELHAAQQKKDAALAAQDAELQRSRIERIGLAALLILALTTAVAIISRQRALARADRRVLAETRRARDAAEEAAALKSRLLDLASHDLKSPLVGAMLTAETIAEESADRPETARLALELQKESQRMLRLVQDLLDGSAAEAGTLVLASARLDLAQLARAAVSAHLPIAARKQQTIEFCPDHTDLSTQVTGDAARLRQVIDNLLSNALKFSPAGATAHVTVHGTADGAVCLTVRDEGPGLTAEDRANLFQRFRRLSAAPTGGESSTGLGLALAHEIVSAHGGKLWVESAPGRGATFMAEIPARS